MRIPLFVAVTVLLSACATPVGKMTDADFNWSETTLDITYQEAYRRLNTGFRSCPDYVAEGQLFTDVQQGHFDISFRTVLGSSNGVVLGVVDVKTTDKGGALVRAGVRPTFDGPGLLHTGVRGSTRALWVSWAEGNTECSTKDWHSPAKK